MTEKDRQNLWRHVRPITNPGLEALPREQLLAVALEREVAYVQADRAYERGEMTMEEFERVEAQQRETSQMLTDEEGEAVELQANEQLGIG